MKQRCQPVVVLSIRRSGSGGGVGIEYVRMSAHCAGHLAMAPVPMAIPSIFANVSFVMLITSSAALWSQAWAIAGVSQCSEQITYLK